MDIERRAGIRYPDDTAVELLGKGSIRGKLADLSIVGARAYFESCHDLGDTTEFRLNIHPKESSRVSPFGLQVSLVWKVRKGEKLEAGFRVISSPESSDFAHYVDYLSYLNGPRHAD